MKETYLISKKKSHRRTFLGIKTHATSLLKKVSLTWKHTFQGDVKIQEDSKRLTETELKEVTMSIFLRRRNPMKPTSSRKLHSLQSPATKRKGVTVIILGDERKKCNSREETREQEMQHQEMSDRM
jgi:hypothetical protein